MFELAEKWLDIKWDLNKRYITLFRKPHKPVGSRTAAAAASGFLIFLWFRKQEIGGFSLVSEKRMRRKLIKMEIYKLEKVKWKSQ